MGLPKAKESCILGREGGEFAGLSGVGSRNRKWSGPVPDEGELPSVSFSLQSRV